MDMRSPCELKRYPDSRVCASRYWSRPSGSQSFTSDGSHASIASSEFQSAAEAANSPLKNRQILLVVAHLGMCAKMGRCSCSEPSRKKRCANACLEAGEFLR